MRWLLAILLIAPQSCLGQADRAFAEHCAQRYAGHYHVPEELVDAARYAQDLDHSGGAAR